jgi:hypothetical protein
VKLGFNNLGSPVFLVPGGDVTWRYTFGGDQGTQMAAADIKLPNGDGIKPAVHLADCQRKQLDKVGNATYFVNIVNLGPGNAIHNLQGGGMSYGFNNVGPPVYLIQGGQTTWRYAFGGDQGSQMATADIKLPNGDGINPAVHLADCQRKQLYIYYSAGREYRDATYFVNIINQGPGPAAHNLQGGGFYPGFNNVGSPTFLAPGGETWWRFSPQWPRRDFGAQMLTADVKGSLAIHLSDKQEKQKDNNGGNATYFVHIVNQGINPAWHNLQGGGFT